MNPMNYLALLGKAVCSNRFLPANSHLFFTRKYALEGLYVIIA